MRPLLAIPNFSEGNDPQRIEAIGRALTSVEGVRLLDTHSDADHNRSVYTLAAQGPSASLVDSLIAGAARAIELLDIDEHLGSHPRIGLLDVAPRSESSM
jgi:glutamate formiminotransferase